MAPFSTPSPATAHWLSVALAERVCAARPFHSRRSQLWLLPQNAPGARRYGKLIYLLMGDRAELSFVLTWLQGLAVENAAALKDVASTAAQTILSALVLEQLAFNRSRWFFSHLDYLPVQVPASLTSLRLPAAAATGYGLGSEF